VLWEIVGGDDPGRGDRRARRRVRMLAWRRGDQPPSRSPAAPVITRDGDVMCRLRDDGPWASRFRDEYGGPGHGPRRKSGGTFLRAGSEGKLDAPSHRTSRDQRAVITPAHRTAGLLDPGKTAKPSCRSKTCRSESRWTSLVATAIRVLFGNRSTTRARHWTKRHTRSNRR
jgi:hypothetical protein